MKIKEADKFDKYLDISRNLRKLYNMKGTAIPVVAEAFGTVSENLQKKLVKLKIRTIETIQTTTHLKSARILRRSHGDLKRLAITQ